MKDSRHSDPPSSEEVPVVPATPLLARRVKSSFKDDPTADGKVSRRDAHVIDFLRQFRALIGAARIYDKNHPRLLEAIKRAEQQLRKVFASDSALVLAIERHGFSLPTHAGEHAPLNDPRGELRALADELLRSGVCSILLLPQINIGELDRLAHQVSHIPRSATPGDTTSRKGWDAWLREECILGIRLNVPTERRDSLVVASLVSAVLFYDDAAQVSSRTRAAASQPPTTFEQTESALGFLANLAPPQDFDGPAAAEDVTRRIHEALSRTDRAQVQQIVKAISLVKPREGETLDLYLERLADSLIVGFIKEKFESGQVKPAEITSLIASMNQARVETKHGSDAGRNRPLDESHLAALCEKFWNSVSPRERARTIRSSDAWCMPVAIVEQYLEPLAAAAERKKSEPAGCEAREVLAAFVGCLGSEEVKSRWAAAAALSEMMPLVSRLWPHPALADLGGDIVQALLAETSPGIAGVLTAVVENLARIALTKNAFSAFELLLVALDAYPRDDEHAHITMLVARILHNDQWLQLVDAALNSRTPHPVIPKLLGRAPDRLVDRLGLLLIAPDGINSLPAMTRLVLAAGEPVLGALESRLYEPRRQRIVTAVHLLASADPIRLANALPRALPSWEWSLQDLAVSELTRSTDPAVVSASARAFVPIVSEAHSMVIPSMIDHIGLAGEMSGVSMLLRAAEGIHPALRDIYLRIKAIEALGRMGVGEAAPVLRQIIRERNGLMHTEPAALRSTAAEVLAALENRALSKGLRPAQEKVDDPVPTAVRGRRYPRAQLPSPLTAAFAGPHSGAARVRTIGLGGAFLESNHSLAVGESVRLEIRTSLRRIHSTAVVRNITMSGSGVEFVHMKAEDRELLRKLLKQHLE
jgi:hypothetical protein